LSLGLKIHVNQTVNSILYIQLAVYVIQNLFNISTDSANRMYC